MKNEEVSEYLWAKYENQLRQAYAAFYKAREEYHSIIYEIDQDVKRLTGIDTSDLERRDGGYLDLVDEMLEEECQDRPSSS